VLSLCCIKAGVWEGIEQGTRLRNTPQPVT